ncbi:MAG TPA: ThiF family adenylyltransferase [Candidatus Nanopelagicaceae bacterium]
MSLPPFFDRITNAVGPLVGSTEKLADFLTSRTIRIHIPNESADDLVLSAGFLFAVNLAARIYPTISLSAPAILAEVAQKLVLSINPLCDVSASKDYCDAELCFSDERLPSAATITVALSGWTVFVDSRPERKGPSNCLTSLAAAALGIGELFRTVFADFLPTGRRAPAPATFPMLGDSEVNNVAIEHVDIGRVHLVGAGAIGQAFLYALSQLDIEGTLFVIDPENIELSNLQRYVLSFMSDVGVSKCEIANRALHHRSVAVIQSKAVWGESEDSMAAETICTALDSARDRIAVQAGLPRRIYNAWTQPNDLGWSRHERFGEDPCLACLYVPAGAMLSQHQLIASALHQNELRVLAYLTLSLPIDHPLRFDQIPKLPQYPIPPDGARWCEKSILQDIIESLKLDPSVRDTWKGRELSTLYREGICGGAIVSSNFGEIPQDVIVPLAHQSALAGVLLATDLVVAQHPELKKRRSRNVESRLNVLAPLSQITDRPRQRTPGCICSDPVYLTRYRYKWHSST